MSSCVKTLVDISKIYVEILPFVHDLKNYVLIEF